MKQLAELEREPGDVEGWRMLARPVDDAGCGRGRRRSSARRCWTRRTPCHRLDFAEALILTDSPANVERAKGLPRLSLRPTRPMRKHCGTGVLAIRVNDRDGAVAAWQQMAAQPDLPPQAR
jgi:hypothetical protein